MKQDYEPRMRMAITGIQNSINHLEHIPKTVEHNLAMGHLTEAIVELRKMAQRLEIPLRASMQT